MFNYRRVTDVYTGFETGAYTLVETPTNRYGSSTALWAAHQSQIEAVKILDDGIAPKSVSVWFSNMTKLKSVDVARLIHPNAPRWSILSSWRHSCSHSIFPHGMSRTYNFNCMFQECIRLRTLIFEVGLRTLIKQGCSGCFSTAYPCKPSTFRASISLRRSMPTRCSAIAIPIESFPWSKLEMGHL